MYQKPIKKTVYTLNINNYAPELLELTRPFLLHWVKKIGAEHFEIKERKFPNLDIEMEKLQIYELGQEHGNDWNIYVDSDALIHPELFDMTDHLNKDTVLHIGADMAGLRWSYDRYFRRDGRNIGSCNWFSVASDLCIDLWKPLDDLSYEDAIKNIHPIPLERHTVVKAEHLVSDYILSRNIAKYGLKFKPFVQILEELKMPNSEFFYHIYLVPLKDKISNICNVINNLYLHSLGKPEEEIKTILGKFSMLPLDIKRQEAKRIISFWDLR